MHRTYTYYSKLKDTDKADKLKSVTLSNLIDLEIILRHNIDRSIHFYRLTSKLVPLATHKDVMFDYKDTFVMKFKHIGRIMKDNNLRVDTHPDQFNVINSDKEQVFINTRRNLLHHAELFNSFGYDLGKMIVHVGSGKNGKEQSIERFITNFKRLPLSVQSTLLIENDDKTYTAKETLSLCQKLNLPMVLDVHHHSCNNNGEVLSEFLREIFETWKNEYFPPKIHFSSGRKAPLDRSHSDYINVDDFIAFIEIAKEINIDFDVMLETKMKDAALISLVNDLKSKSNYEWRDQSTLIVKKETFKSLRFFYFNSPRII